MKIQIAIVSEQTLANLIPALMERPDLVYLVCSEYMAAKGLHRRLAKLLQQDAITVEMKEQAPDVGLKNIHDYALQLAIEIEGAHSDAEIVLNATGGTKLMALGFVEVFRDIAKKIIYTDTAHRRIEVLPDKLGQAASPEPMRSVLDVPKYLAAQGFQFGHASSDDTTWRERVAMRKAACKYLGKHAAQLQQFIGAVNGMANGALERIPDSDEEVLRHPRQQLNQVPRSDWERALGELMRASLIDWRHGERDVEFSDVESARFLRGGWLEEYAWHMVKDAQVDDVRMSVKGAWTNSQKSTNEFDVLACHDNQLLFIECKTLKYRDENDSDIAYKVDSLGQDARGLFGQTWLLSAREPSEILTARARQAGIRVVGPQGLPRLKDTVLDWKKN